jgi:thiol-disulfide isomerase/thioredoxin
MGVGGNGTLDDLKAVLKENFMKNDFTEEDVDQLFAASEFFEAGSAEDYNFFLIKRGYGSAFFTESQEEYREEYDALYDAAESYAANFTFMRPLALAQMVSEGTGLEFETKDLKDNSISSSDLFGSHKVTMLNIWETTCSSCMSEMPDIKKLAGEFEEKGGQIIGLVYDATEEDLIQEAKEIADDLDLNFVNLLPTQEMRDFFKAQAFPTTYFFNEKGEVIGEPIVGAAVEDYAVRMNEYLAK